MHKRGLEKSSIAKQFGKNLENFCAEQFSKSLFIFESIAIKMRIKLVASFSLVLLVLITITYTNQASAQTVLSQSKETTGTLEQKIFKSDTVVIYPIFTQAAYGPGGFYYYYGKHCDTRCLTVPLPPKPFGLYVSSGQAYLVLSSLGFDVITDADVDKNPYILKEYKNVIVLHNEYVTQTEFKAITAHQNVIYLYPNALYAQIKVDYGTNQITLVKGHQYPAVSISNGFGWKQDNSKFEYNTDCASWNFYRITNGWMLNCYPDIVISTNKRLLNSLLERIQ